MTLSKISTYVYLILYQCTVYIHVAMQKKKKKKTTNLIEKSKGKQDIGASLVISLSPEFSRFYPTFEI